MPAHPEALAIFLSRQASLCSRRAFSIHVLIPDMPRTWLPGCC